jgi:hypothetical protein
MVYDFGRKEISKMTGLTGVESKNIARQLSKQGFDYQSFDWKTIGEDLYGYGKRTGGVKKKLETMYGVSIGRTGKAISHDIGRAKVAKQRFKREQSRDAVLRECQRIFNRRSKKQKAMDLKIDAKHIFDPGEVKGVKKWKKNPNMYDIWGVDDVRI